MRDQPGVAPSGPEATAAILDYLERRPALLPLALASLFALIGAGDMEYGYYTFLRFALTTTGVFVIIHALRSERFGWIGLGVPMIVLWAPATWIPLPAETWKILDVMVAGALIVAGILIPGPAGSRSDGSQPYQWWKVALLVFGIGALIAGMALNAMGSATGCVEQFDGRSSWCE